MYIIYQEYICCTSQAVDKYTPSRPLNILRFALLTSSQVLLLWLTGDMLCIESNKQI